MVQPGPEERVLIARYLRSVHFRVEIVAGEEAARAALERNDVALVLLSDEFRPARAGPLAEFVRQASKRHVPVVLLTRNAFLVDVERYLREEVDVCLAKPVKLAELAHAARRAIDLTSALRGGVRERE
jgi:CheY-like chemotaxis protein